MGLFDVASLWVGPELTWMEQVCLISFRDHGHRTVLYCYDDVLSVPEGVEIRDANEVMPTKEIIYHKNTGSPAFHSDVFRLRMLDRTNYLWVDTDAYCLRPFVRPDHGFYFGWGSDRRRILYTGVLGLPKSSQILRSMLELTQDEYPIPPWFPENKRNELAEKKASGEPVHMSLLPWGVCGPEALDYFAKTTGEVKFALDGDVFYPVPFASTRSFHRTHLHKDVVSRLTDQTLSIHLYGRRFRNIFALTKGIPPEGSFADELCKKHGIDPTLTAHLFKRKEIGS